MKLEIERKFLLKALPSKKFDEKIDIDQYYWKNANGVWERARTYHSDINGDSYIHTIKKNIGKGINTEDEKELTKSQFDDFKNKCLSDDTSKFIKKERFVFKNDDGLKWEVDNFDNGYKLIIAELEIPKKDYKITIPDFILDVFLMEVTEYKQFSNRNLSIDIKNINKYTQWN